ncbi:MAG: extracellular solute-binding protein [Bradyrhizobium sp.]|uniref:extracellular solute-binding protein n=1 Tax=Bradyrhizobium sp. TaxID=376 RepID=UPI001D89E206|nr:extracellular solute-binding protein [Bradyrhizobium sp.]MBV9564938.1 extracellular solute-binding protein [Bradyrhizobium sp.]
MRRLGIAAAAFVAALVWADGVEAEQRIVIYSANDATLNKLVATEFTKATGVQADVVSAGSGVLVKRIETEKDRPQGDIVWGISRSLLQSNVQYFDAYASQNKDAIPVEFRDPQDRWIGTNLHLLVVLQNTKSVPEAEGPKSWEDLLAAKWKGNVAFTDPANSGSAYSNITMLVDLWGGGNAGWDKVAKLIGNTRMLNRSSLVFQGVGNGEYGLGVSLEYAGYLWLNNGAPVKVIYPSDGTIVQMEGVAIIKNGPNTPGARQFVDYVNRKDVREMILKETFRRPARQDLDLPNLPGKMPKLSDIKLVKYDEEGWTAKRGETMDRIKDVIQETR